MKIKVLKNLLFILLASIGYSQQYPDLGPNQILPNGIFSTTLNANINQSIQLDNLYETTNYTISNIPYVAQTNTGNIVPNMALSTYSNMLDIGFNFCFFDKSYSQFYICSNGWISFIPQICDPNWLNCQLSLVPTIPLPNNVYNNPKNCIFGVWQNWNPIPVFGGSIKYQTQGIAPNRKLVVSWINVPIAAQMGNSPDPNNNGNFHIILYETTNIIEVHIQSKPSYSWTGDWTYGGLSKATQGLRSDLNGTTIIPTPNRNATVWSAYNDAHRWTPSGNEIIPTLVWYEVGNPIPLDSNVISINVTPSTNGSYYTCHFEYPLCSGDWTTYIYPNTIPDTVFIKPAIGIINDPEDNIEDIPISIVNSHENILENILINNDLILSSQTFFDSINDQYYYIPNCFTPNGDEFNNNFCPIFSNEFIFNNFYFSIYNRYGELIFKSFDPKNYWDGSFNNKTCPSDIYSYLINVNNKIISGHVTIIK